MAHGTVGVQIVANPRFNGGIGVRPDRARRDPDDARGWGVRLEPVTPTQLGEQGKAVLTRSLVQLDRGADGSIGRVYDDRAERIVDGREPPVENGVGEPAFRLLSRPSDVSQFAILDQFAVAGGVES